MGHKKGKSKSKEPKTAKEKSKKGSRNTKNPRKRKAERVLGDGAKTTKKSKPIVGRSALDHLGESGALTPQIPSPDTPELEPDPDHAAKLLREEVNRQVSVRRKRIAKALIDTAEKGNMSGARILVEITGANKVPAGERSADVSHLDLPNPTILEAEPQWREPEVGDIWVGHRWESPAKAANPDPERPPDL